MESVFELEKKILKAQSPEEIDKITRKMNTSQLRNVIKLLVDRMTPTNVKLTEFKIVEMTISFYDSEARLCKYISRMEN